ncbi:hypothetical protein AK812_SmicGene46108, partial [Symbiodinium microadriaticum]
MYTGGYNGIFIFFLVRFCSVSGAVDDCLLSWEAIAEFTLQGRTKSRPQKLQVHANTSETISSILELAKSPITPEDLVASCRSLPRKEV